MIETRRTFYLDMDGVVADWAAGAADITGYRPPNSFTYYPDQDWAKIRDTSRFYRDLPLMQGCQQLVELSRCYRDELGWTLLFLTAISHLNDMPWMLWDKMLWAQQHFPDIPVHFGPYSRDKALHCEPGDILVDDRPDNCAQWRAAGGKDFWVAGSDLGPVILEVSEDLERRRALARLSQANFVGLYL